jgi:hypothetical protein
MARIEVVARAANKTPEEWASETPCCARLLKIDGMIYSNGMSTTHEGAD